jgi:hypothetical protein
LAYGLKGVEWFSGPAMFQPNSTELNECGKDVTAINADLKALGPTLMKLHSVDVFHTEPLPRDTRVVPADHWVQVFSYGYPGLVLGMFKDDAGVDYAMVSNTNYEGKQLVAMEIRRKFPVKTVERFDREKKAWVPMKVTDILLGNGAQSNRASLRFLHVLPADRRRYGYIPGHQRTLDGSPRGKSVGGIRPRTRRRGAVPDRA